MDRPVRLFQFAAPGLASRAPAGGGSAAGGVHGFPAALSSFVGRAGAMGEVAGLLDRVRLVTVTGPGVRVRPGWPPRRPGRWRPVRGRGVAGRAGAGAATRSRSPAVVAVALGVREQPGKPVAGTLARVLARQQLLLVLDNCEHVLGAAAELCAGLVAACDDMRILATSREALRVGGEARYRLAPLAVPDPG